MKNSAGNIKDTNVQIIRERSIISCFMNGLRVMSDKYTLLIRFLWPSSLLMTLLPIPGYLVFLGRVDTYLSQWLKQNDFPVLSSLDLKKETFNRALRRGYSFLYILVLIALIAGIFFVMEKYDVSVWYAILSGFVVSLAALPAVRPMMQLSNTDDTFADAMKTFPKGMQNYAQHFSFEVVALLLSVFVSIIGFMPFILLVLVYTRSQQAIAIGDASTLPALFPFYLFLGYLIAMVVLQHILLGYTFCKYLLLGNIMAAEKLVDENEKE